MRGDSASSGSATRGAWSLSRLMRSATKSAKRVLTPRMVRARRSGRAGARPGAPAEHDQMWARLMEGSEPL
jgi:hypothetical protein